MGFSIRRMRTLVMKEIKDLSKNMNVLLVCLLPLVFAMVYPRLNVVQTFSGMVLSKFFIMNSSMIAPVAMAMLISEEKEKKYFKNPHAINGITNGIFIGESNCDVVPSKFNKYRYLFYT